ncbi:hypothetical protein [Paenibacillus sedimenti]|uniref:Uncharacterized protein n=1 Tax=Paenibacillus sedimenti TaxID=2770274 RepID=A0A926QMX9_9BACL|nr:hypothetical protein [Paenibacillus sedimenti]MBD0384177.1 hypothetical protein [Paenibacillus sedimenti]
MELHDLKLNLTELINNLTLRMDSIADSFKSLQLAEANERLAYFIDDISVVAEVVAILKSAYPLLDLDELNAKLSTLLEQSENEDYLYVADLISYELKPLLEYWGELLQDA